MHSCEWKKFFAAFVVIGISLWTINGTAYAMSPSQPPSAPAYLMSVADQPSTNPSPTEESIEKLLANASVSHGQEIAGACAVCHTLDKDGPNRKGPNLFDVVGRHRASMPGFSYSPAMKDLGGNWTISDLDRFIKDPRAFVAGTYMSFAGVPEGQDRADLIAYLKTLVDNPPVKP